MPPECNMGDLGFGLSVSDSVCDSVAKTLTLAITFEL